MTETKAKKTFDPDALRRKYREERDKRLRVDRDTQFQAAEGAFGHFTDDTFVEKRDTRAAVEEDIDVLVVGGGFGGLISSAKLVDAGVESFRIVEQAADFGGTWYWNRYPGIRCDIESYVYMPLLEEVGTIPSERYVGGAEVFAHCQAIGRHYGLYERALFQTKVTRMEWSDADERWHATTDRGDMIRARFIMIGQGPLMKVKLPGIPGIADFKGKMFHSSRWDYVYTGGSVDGGMTRLADKKVAVIGTGATGIQIVPTLAEDAAEVLVFQRTPSAIDTRDNTATDLDWFKSQPAGWQRSRMDNFLTVISGKPHSENVVGDRWTDFWSRIGKLMAERHRTGSTQDPHEIVQGVDFEKMEELRDRVSELVTDPETAAAATPWYNYLCKRPLFSDTFLQSLNRDNVTLVDTQGRGVDRIDATSLHVGERKFEVDCIVFATGFDVGAPASTSGGYEVVGRDGLTLSEYWSDGIRSLHGTQMNGFPNLHIVGGTGQGTLAFNYTHVLDIQGEHAVDQIAHCLEAGVGASEVSADEEVAWRQLLEEKHVDHAQYERDCTPGFLNNEGNADRPSFLGATYGGGPIEYTALIRTWREDRKQAHAARQGAA